MMKICDPWVHTSFAFFLNLLCSQDIYKMGQCQSRNDRALNQFLFFFFTSATKLWNKGHEYAFLFFLYYYLQGKQYRVIGFYYTQSTADDEGYSAGKRFR